MRPMNKLPRAVSAGFAAVIAEDLECLDRVKAALVNFQGDQDFVSQADRAEKALSPGGWRG